MKIYIDLILILNFFFDFLLLLATGMILRRKVDIPRLMIAAFIGSLTVFILFFKISNIALFFLKLLSSIIMSIVAFKFNNIRYTMKNIFYLYVVSIVLGGFLYLLKIQFSYNYNGLIAYDNGLSINFIILIIISPIIIYIYIRQLLNLKNNYNNYYYVDIEEFNIKCTGYLDTGNKLLDPYKKRPVIFIDRTLFKDVSNIDMILVPYKTVNHTGIINCIKINRIIINDKEIKKEILLGLMDEKIKIDGVGCILNGKVLEGYYD